MGIKKSFVLVSFISLTFAINIIAQIVNNKQEIDSVGNKRNDYTPKVQAKIDAVNLLYYDEMVEDKLNNIDTLKKVARLLYEANETDAFAFYHNSNRGIILNKLDDRGRNIHISPSAVNRVIFNKIEEKISPIVFALTATSYFLKVKVINNEITKCKLVNTNDYTARYDIKVKVEDIIKGENRFLVGDEITFYYFPNWRADAESEFKVGNSYFLPLEPRLDPYNNAVLALVTLDESLVPTNKRPSLGCFLISNNDLIDPTNYFGFGDRVSWTGFRSSIINLIDLIKSW